MAGVIFDPIHNELFAAEKGSGATLNDRRLRVTAREQLEEAMLVTGNPRHLIKTGKTAGPIFDDVSKSGAILRYFGATALDLAYVAAGRCDGCWHYTIQPWDIAAGMLLVEEAGGIVSEIDGAPAHAHSKNVMASNRMLHAPIRQLLAKTA